MGNRLLQVRFLTFDTKNLWGVIEMVNIEKMAEFVKANKNPKIDFFGIGICLGTIGASCIKEVNEK